MVKKVKKGRKRRGLFNWTYTGEERRRSRRIIFLFLWIGLYALLFYRFVISSCVVDGDSMYPTLKVGSAHLINRYVYFFKQPQRGEIIVLTKKKVDSFYLIKRVVGLPGDKLEIKFGSVYINDKKLDESYVKGRTGTKMVIEKLGEHEFFVMGDNRLYSFDSRNFGPVHRKEIVGKVNEKGLFAFW